MIRTIKILIYFISAVLLAWLLPWCYHFAFSSSESIPFTLYSSIVDDFVYVESTEQGLVYSDISGNSYTESEFDSLLPFFYYRQLATDGKLPETIKGVPVTPQLIARTNFIFRHSPTDINKRASKLYPLLESMSGRVDLKMPEDVFRLGKSIEFIDMKTNSVNWSKSEMFNRVMTDKGFAFPERAISGNPTTRKEYDSGYLIIDDSHKVWHLKMNVGRPFFRDSSVPANLGMEHVFITEFSDRSMFGFLSDGNNNFYVLRAPEYELVKLPVEGFDPVSENMMIIGDMLSWTVRVSGPGRVELFAVDARDFSLLGRHNFPIAEDVYDKAGEYIFPFEMSFTSHSDAYVKPRMAAFSWHALWLNLALAVCYSLLRRRNLRCHLVQAVLIVPLGLFLFIPLLLIERR